MKQPEPSGLVKGRTIILADVIKHLESFKIKDPIAWIVGGLANHGQTKNDIDILINLSPKESDSSVAKVLRFRIQRSLPKELWDRIHWLYNDGAGPFTSHIPLFSLEARSLPVQRMEMAASEIVPGRFFRQLKAVQGRLKKDIFTIKALQDIIPAEAYPVEVNQKYDGMRAQIHYAKGLTKFFSEDGGEITGRFPKFVQELKSHNMEMVLDVEITGELKGKPIGRSDVSGYVHMKSEPDDSPFTANVHDIVFLKGNDIHEWPRDKRMATLKQHGNIGAKFKVIPFRIANNAKELGIHVKFFSEQKASEGAMIKSNASIYELDGLTRLWWKYKRDFVIDAKIVEATKVKNSNSYNYLCVIGDSIPVGRTYNTDIKADVGDIIQVAFGNLNKYTDGQKAWYNWVFPRVIGLQEDKSDPDDEITADLLNKESGGFIEEKSFPSRYKNLSAEALIENVENYNPKAQNNRILLDDHRLSHAWFSMALENNDFKYSLSQIKKLHEIIAEEMETRGFVHNTPLELPTSALQKLVSYRRHMNLSVDLALFDAFDEFMLSQRKKRFVYQHHWRGKSVHGDFRLEDPKAEHLNGWTLLVEIEGKVKSSVDTLDQAKEIDSGDISKINYKTGTPKGQKIQVVEKGTQPLVWLTLEGRARPGTVGATREHFGVFDIIDKGLYEPGADKPFFKEYFLEGKVFRGRYVLRKLPASGNLKDAGKVPFVWFFWKPEEQSPYILSSRAIRKQDFPVDNSWLPSEWEKKIPNELKWWNKNLTQEEATELLQQARKYLLKQDVLSEQDLETDTFVLHRHWWKGQKVVRDLPVEHWDLRFSKGYEFSLDRNPLFDPGKLNAVYKLGHDIKNALQVDEKEIAVGEEGNPNKRIPAFVERLDSGKVNIIAHTENFMSVDFKGRQLTGFFTFKRLDPGSNQWLMSKGKLPKVYSETLDEFEIEHLIDLSDPQLRLSRNEIANRVGCGMSAVYSWQKKSNIL